jgi:hypothetical protein
MDHRIGTHEEWRVAHEQLPAREKHTRLGVGVPLVPIGVWR